MKKWIILIGLLVNPITAHADCALAKTALTNLLQNQYAMVAEFELDHKPTVIFVNPNEEWIEITFDMETACVVAHGRGFGLVWERKA